MTTEENGLRVTRDVIQSIRKRVNNLRYAATASLVLIALAMVGGFVAFYNAGEIVARENIESYHAATTIKSSVESISRQIQGLTILPKDSQNKELETVVKNIDTKLTSINEKANQIDESIGDEKQNKKTLNEQISIYSMITRVSSGIILIFLVQVVVKLYRYNVRLAAFYEGRADALEIAGITDTDLLDKVAKILSPDSIDFGDMPELPTKQIIDAVKDLSKNLGKRD